MGTIYANEGDTIVIQRREYVVEIRSNFAQLKNTAILCEGCQKNDASDYEYMGRHLCPTCINRAMKYVVAYTAINHLMQNDEELHRTLCVMDAIDTSHDRQIQHVDFHSSSWDAAWSWDDVERHENTCDIGVAISDVIESRALVDRT